MARIPLLPISSSTTGSSTSPSRNNASPEPGGTQQQFGERSTMPLRAPPPLIHAKSPYCPVPLPPQLFGIAEVILNPLLLPSPDSEIQVDFRLSSSNDPVPSHYLSEPATEPQLPSLTVTHPELPWPIIVHPSANSSCVTVADVLHTIRGSLSLPVTEREYRDWLSGLNGRRENRSGRHRQDENRMALRVGMTRLSFLAGKTCFVGLAPCSLGSDVWVLQVEHGHE